MPDTNYSPTWSNGAGDYDPPIVPVWDRTLVYDADRNRQVMWLEGFRPLPVGTQIFLHDVEKHAHGVATVKSVRIDPAAGSFPAGVVLDCSVEARWWDAHSENDAT